MQAQLLTMNDVKQPSTERQLDYTGGKALSVKYFNAW